MDSQKRAMSTAAIVGIVVGIVTGIFLLLTLLALAGGAFAWFVAVKKDREETEQVLIEYEKAKMREREAADALAE